MWALFSKMILTTDETRITRFLSVGLVLSFLSFEDDFFLLFLPLLLPPVLGLAVDDSTT